MALILLALGALIAVPTVSLMSTNLMAHRQTDRSTMQLYAADAGIEYTLWHIINDYEFDLPATGEQSSVAFPETINDKTLTITIDNEGEDEYKITSTAISSDGTSTTVESTIAVSYLDLAWMFDSAITSPGDVTIKPHSDIAGDVVYGGDLDNKGTIDGDEIIDPLENWPQADDLVTFYMNQVGTLGLTPYPDDTIDISSGTEASPYPIGPLYRDGDLTITGSGWARLDGFIYVTGNLNIMPQGTIDLNGETIFAEGWINVQPNCTIIGSGCIIAVGDVNFQPYTGTSEDDFIFVMSIEGTSTVKPNGSFYGSIAGSTEVELFPGTTLQLTEVPEEGLNYPGADDEEVKVISDFQIETFLVHE